MLCRRISLPAIGFIGALVLVPQAGGIANAAPVAKPLAQTPVLSITELCWGATGLAAAIRIEHTGAQAAQNESGEVVRYSPVDCRIGDADRRKFAEAEIHAQAIGETITATVTVPGTYAVGQVVRLFALADDPNSDALDPDSPPSSATVSGCRVPAPRAAFTVTATAKPRSLRLTAAVSPGAPPVRYVWRAVIGKSSMALGEGRVVEVTLPRAGRYSLTLTVRARDGRTSSAARTVRVG